MRIVGGRLRGRALAAPMSQAIRPTADRLREALFNILVHAYGDPVTGARVLDLFAGTGALGLEALSRGAAFALFIDDAAEARALLRENVAVLIVPAAGSITIYAANIYRHLEADLFATILLLQSLPFLSAVALVWLERFSDHKLKEVAPSRVAI